MTLRGDGHVQSLDNGQIWKVANPIGSGADLSACQFISVGLGASADSRLARDRIWNRGGKAVSGDAAERKQGGVRLHGDGTGGLQPVAASTGRASCMLVAGASSDAVGVMLGRCSGRYSPAFFLVSKGRFREDFRPPLEIKRLALGQSTCPSTEARGFIPTMPVSDSSKSNRRHVNHNR